MKSTKFLLITILILLPVSSLLARDQVLIVFEGKDLPTSPARGDGLQLYQLLGHFDLEKTIVSSEDYRPGEVDKHAYVFFIGFSKDCKPSPLFLQDASQYRGTLVWLNTGILEYHARFPLGTKYGFEPLYFDSQSGFDSVIAPDKNWKFTKSDPNLTVLKVLDPQRVEILAEARGPNKKHSPYAVRSGNFYYFADSPFAYATGTDRYLFFADRLHDILKQRHPESHTALIRIEDVHPLENPEPIRRIADFLWSEGVPFLISVTPFYVDPGKKIRVALSEKPDMADALRYAQSRGGTIVMHGVTHQYRGVTAVDFEFWDESNNRPVGDENPGDIERRIESGVIELTKNGLFPIAWETPHYTASETQYRQIGKIFSTAIEVRLSINDLDYSQFFPYVIHKDRYGQKILPENLGYVPRGEAKEMEKAVQELIEAARVNLYVRDGFATAFFHPFLPLGLLKKLVEGIKAAGYTYTDIKNDQHLVRLKDRVILTGGGSFTLGIDDQYLNEIYMDASGLTARTEISKERFKGEISRTLSLEKGWIYAAEPVENRKHELTPFEKLSFTLKRLWTSSFPPKRHLRPAVAAILWNSSASGAALLDQESFFTALRSVAIPVDKIPLGGSGALSKYNLLVVPYGSAELLSHLWYENIEKFVRDGGHLITDTRNPLASSLGVKFGTTPSQLEKVRDQLFPDILLNWGAPEMAYRIEAEKEDAITCTNDANQGPVGIVRRYGKGKLMVLSARFDPVSGGGYARFPYLVEWLKNYFQLSPVLRRDALEVYFDPGLHKGLNIEALVKRWSEAGIRVIHAAGWHEYPKYTYDYDRLIRLCHAYGMIVYAWLEPPQITKRFYDQHPEWREKNYEGKDVRYDWRYPLALTEPACLSATLDWMQKFLISHDWDGVNLAEIYFGGEGAPASPETLTPFHPSARKQFEKAFGFDPVKLFDPNSAHYYKRSPQSWKTFVDFRVNLNTELTSHFLQVASDALREKPDAQIILTILDQKTVPELRAVLGTDVDQLLLLRKKFRFALQVEDPASYWNRDPRRYLEIGKTYKELLGGHGTDLIIDLNILRFREESYRGLFPTLSPTGTEAYLLLHSAVSTAPRATIYSEATVLPQDLVNLPYALASSASFEIEGDRYRVKADYATTLYLGEGDKEVLLDGKTVYPSREGYLFIPAGEHTIRAKEASLQLFNNGASRPRLLSASCNILHERAFERGMEFMYHSSSRCAVSFNKVPMSVFVDEQEVSFTVAKEEQRFGILLPSGTHRVRVILEDAVSYGIELTSLWSSALTVLFGLLSSGILVILVILVRLRRKKASCV